MDAELSFGQWLKRRRKALDLTQDHLARDIGCAVGTIRKLEADALQPSREIAGRLAERLGVPGEARADFVAFARGRANAGEVALFARPLGPAVQRRPEATPKPPSDQAPHPDPTPRYPLPVPLTPLIGRAREIAVVSAILQRPDVRLLTLLGPPGVGKTRLALQVASDLRVPFRTGVCFVALAPIRDPDLVPAAIAQALDLHEAGDQSLIETLQSSLRDKQLLLVLDNVEQVVAASPVITALLAAAPKLKVLSTSRVALHLSGEHEYAVPPLELPDLLHLPPAEMLAECPAVALFQARAQAVQPNFALSGANAQAVAAICHRLDGLPLVLELAATRCKVFSPEALLARLDQRLPLLSTGARDLPPRQQTLRSAIAWSYDLLSAAEQILFEQLAVFAGGWTLEAAEAVITSTVQTARPQLAEGFERANVLDGLTSLIDQSLVQQAIAVTPGISAEPRFTMLETIREYALERLAERGEEPRVRQRYAAHYLALAEQAERELQGPDARRWLDRLEAEHDNLRAVLAWCLEEQETSRARDQEKEAFEQHRSLSPGLPVSLPRLEIGLRLAAALWWFWWARGHGREGRRWLAQALAADTVDAANDQSLAVRAKALVAAGVLAATMDIRAAREPLEAALAIYQRSGDQLGAAFPLVMLGWLSALNGDPAAGQALIADGLALFRTEPSSRQWDFGRALFAAAMCAMQWGDYASAHAACDEALALFRGLGQPYGLSQALNFLGDLARLQGDYATAAAHYRESLPLARQAGVRSDIASLLHNLGYVALAQGDISQAAALFGEGLMMQREIGYQQGIAECLAGCAAVAAVRGQAELAARLFGATDALSTHASGPMWPAEQAEYSRHQAAAQAQLPPSVWESARAAGRAMPLAQAIEEAHAGSVVSENAQL
jgi:predicted ATPase/transcriptional regulator with XRE-family HTH domain